MSITAETEFVPVTTASGERVKEFLFTREPSGMYYVHRKVGGKWKNRSLKTPDLATALARYAVHPLTRTKVREETKYAHYTFAEFWPIFKADWKKSPATMKRYDGLFRNYCKDLFEMEVADATVQDVLAVKAKAMKEGGVHGKPLSDSSLRSLSEVMLGRLFSHSMDPNYEIRIDNPCHRLGENNRILMSEIMRCEEAEYAEYEQIDAWAAAFDSSWRKRKRPQDLAYDIQLAAMVQLTTEIGWRIGEMLGSRFEDWHLSLGKHGKVHIQRQVALDMKVKDTESWYGPLKGARRIPQKARWVGLSGYAREVFDNYVAKGVEMDFLRVVDGEVVGPLFPTFKQTPRSVNGVISALADAGKRAGLPAEITHHSLRHTYASNMMLEGYSYEQIAKLMGNSKKVVEDRYAHFRPDAAFDERIGNSGRPATSAAPDNVIDIRRVA